MENEIYKTPESDVGKSGGDIVEDTSAIENRNAKFVVLALFVTPVITSLAYCIFSVFLDIGRGLASNAQVSVEFDVVLGLFLLSLGISFIFSLFVGLPLNWFLTKIDKVKLIYFLVVGAFLPVFFSLTASDNRDAVIVLLMAATGAFCLGTFWYFAAYMPSRKGR